MKKCLLFLVLLSAFKLLPAQELVNEYLENRIRPADTLSKSLHFNFYNFNFVRNYEYSNHFHDGYTLYGTQLEPRLVYLAHPHLAITAGAYIRKDFGREGIYDAKPLFNLIYQKKNLSLIFGSLEGNIQHCYIEPLYDFERKITSPQEYGTQLLIDGAKLNLDSWIAWQKMIYKGERLKEEITGGLRMDVRLAEQGHLRFSLPVQLLAYHQGGQIDLLKEIPISTLMNGATGIKMQWLRGGQVKEIYSANYFAFYKDFSPVKRRAWQGGFGVWLNAGINTIWGDFMAAYWKGNNFISIKGMPLYQSVSETLYDEGFKESSRSMLVFRYAYRKELVPGLYLDVRFEPHIDFKEHTKNLQFNHSLFLTYKEDFSLFKKK